MRARKLLTVLALFLTCVIADAQTRPQGPYTPLRFPPEIVIERPFADVIKIAPKFFTVDHENERVRVLRAKLPGSAKIRFFDQRPGLLVAFTDVHLRFRSPDNKFQDIHVAAGETRRLWEDTHSIENLSIRACEFLFIEAKS